MAYAVEIGSGAMAYITKFHKDRFKYFKVDLMGEGSLTHSMVIS
jgi:hypothetical protein